MTEQTRDMDDIQAELKALQRELNREGVYDDEIRETINTLRWKVEQAVGDVPADADEPESEGDYLLLSDELEAALEDFEDDHPQLILRIQHLIRALVNAGL